MNADEFNKKVDALRAAPPSVSSYQNEMILTRFQTAWWPLISHLHDLVTELAAKGTLPASARLNVQTELNEKPRSKELNMTFLLQKDRRAENPGPDYAFLETPEYESMRWETLARLSYYTGPGDYTSIGLIKIFGFKTVTLKDAFHKHDGNKYALMHLSGDDSLDDTPLHPARMDAAKSALEGWLVRQVACNFQQRTFVNQIPLAPKNNG